jgi:hypothetical protein
MDGHEPQMSKRRLDNWVEFVIRIAPGEKGLHVLTKAISSGRFIVDFFPAIGAGENLHGTRCRVPPCADFDLAQAAASGRKERAMPAE